MTHPEWNQERSDLFRRLNEMEEEYGEARENHARLGAFDIAAHYEIRRQEIRRVRAALGDTPTTEYAPHHIEQREDGPIIVVEPPQPETPSERDK